MNGFLALAATAFLVSRAHGAALEELLSAAGADAPPGVAAPSAAPLVPRSPRRSYILKVLTFNIKSTPAAPFQGFGRERFAVIGRMLAAQRAAGRGPDIVVMQEAFGGGIRRVRDLAGFPHNVDGPNTDGSLLDAGLFAMSEHPIVEREVLTYPRDTCAGPDCFAAKGAMRVRLRVPGLPFPVDVHTTHLQSGPSEGRDRRRRRQMDLFAEAFVTAQTGRSHPAFFAGDFNSRPPRSSYAHFVSRTGLLNAGEVCRADAAGCRLADGTARKHLLEETHDQQFYVPEGPGVYRVRPVYAARTFGPLGALSDHLAYEVHYEISW